MAAKPLRLIVCAAAGRMGARVASLAAADPRFDLTACLFHKQTGDSHGAPSFMMNAGMSVCSGRLCGAIWSGDPAVRLKPAPRLCSRMP